MRYRATLHPEAKNNRLKHRFDRRSWRLRRHAIPGYATPRSKKQPTQAQIRSTILAPQAPRDTGLRYTPKQKTTDSSTDSIDDLGASGATRYRATLHPEAKNNRLKHRFDRRSWRLRRHAIPGYATPRSKKQPTQAQIRSTILAPQAPRDT